VCVPCLTDDHCPPGNVCRMFGSTSACVPGCGSDARCAGAGGDGGAGAMKCCGGQCVNSGADPQNCGACGTTCNAAHAGASCVDGNCTAGKCQSGWADCNMDPKDGCEAKLDYDPLNCGGCGMKCAIANAIVGCGPPQNGMSGCYIRACNFGFDDCDGNPANGCETNVSADVKNCGACGMVCPAVPHATVGCVNASCVLTMCTVGFADCDNNAKNGCETTVANDKNNCGKCGNACGMGQICINGGCTCANCNISNATTKCVNNACVFDHCVQGFADCDNNLNNGCEVDTTSDVNNCGACGNVCPVNTPACVAGVCSAKTCLNNKLWQKVTCTTPSWVWSRDSGQAKDLMTANAKHVLATGCNHGQPQPDLGQGHCSLDGTGWVSTMTWVMSGCNNSWWHIGGSYTGQCGGHDGDTWRHLVLGDNDCFPY
jgi:hypothetical protein